MGHVARMMYKRNAYKVWWGNMKERPRRGWEDSVKTYVTGIGWKNVEWINLTQVRDRASMVAVMNAGFHEVREYFCLDEELSTSEH